MPHSAIIKDKDPCFEIDPRTRAIKKVSAVRKTIMQYDHNSERFTFKLPKMVEGHDMMECNKVEVHYINIDATTQEQNAGVYTVKDLQADADDDEKLKCSWLISQNATKLCGSLNFLLRFSCVAEDGSIEYAWNTEIFSGSSITSGLYNSDVIVEQYADVLEQWKKELEETGGSVGTDGSVDLRGYEKKSNKTTTIDADSTDEQYPSAKAVVDYANRTTGNLNELKTPQKDTLVNAINTLIDVAELHDGHITSLGKMVMDKADKETTLSGYGITDAFTKDETDRRIGDAIASGELGGKAEKDLSNVDTEDFLAKLNEVLPDGDEVSY